MQKVIVVNLNGNAYQLDEPAYQALAAYLDRAAQRLAANPDRAEILADIERAIADKCGRFLGPHKTVVSAAEVDRILAEMGPVEGEPADGASAKDAGASGSQRSSTAGESARSQSEPVKRLYQIPDGAVVSGVCNGVGAYFDVDPTIVRIVFVLLAFATAGVWVLVYVVLMFVIPIAETPEEHAAAHGLPFNAHELIRQAKQKYAELANEKAWKWEWKRQRRMWRYQRRAWKREWRSQSGTPPWAHAATASYATQLAAGILAPIFTVLNVALFFVWAIATISLLMNHTIFGWAPPDDLPLWAALLIMLLSYQVIAWPLHAARRSSHAALGYGYGSRAAADMLGLVAAVLLFLLAYHFIPDVHDFVKHAGTLLPSFWEDIRQSFQ